MSGNPNSYAPTALPYILTAEEDFGAIPLGGFLKRYKAAAALKLGDAVYLSATAGVVNKSASAGNNALRAGIVVGGTNTDMTVLTDSALYDSLVAADTDEYVLVLNAGISYVIVDASVTVAGSPIALSTTTAGRVRLANPISVAGAALTGAPGIGTLAVSGAPGGAVLSGAPSNGDLAVSAPTKGTLVVDAGATPVTSSAANGDILTGAPGGGVLSGDVDAGDLAVSAPTLGTLAVSGAPSAGTLAVSAPSDSGDGNNTIIGMLLETASAAGQIRKALIYLA
jgi:hypothetical protein